MRRLGGGRPGPPKWFVDSFDKYPLGANLEDGGYNEGDEITSKSVFFFQSWVAGQSYVPAFYGDSTFDSLTEGVSIEGVSDGLYWGGTWSCRESFVPAYLGDDSFNSYSEGYVLDEPGIGEAWSSEWVATPQVITSYATVGNRIELASSFWSGNRLSTDIVIPISRLNAQAGDLLVLCVMRRAALTGLSGWTLLAEQAATMTGHPTVTQIAAVYSRPFSEISSVNSLRVGVASLVRSSYSLLVLRAPAPFQVQATALGTYTNAVANPGLHPIQPLVAAKNGSLGLFVSTCKAAATNNTYSLAAPWIQATPTTEGSGLPTSLFCSGVKALDAGQDIAAGVLHASHALVNNHEGAEISVIFQPV